MTKSIYLMRHGAQQKSENPVGGIWDAEANISSEGEVTIILVASKLEGFKFSFYACSPLIRARQTADIVAGQGKIVNVVDDLGPDTACYAEWDWFNDLVKIVPSPTVRDCYVFNAGCIRKYGSRVDKCIRGVLGLMKDGQGALLVSHQPLVEAGVATATGIWPPTLSCEKGGIIRLDYTDDDNVPIVTYIPVPK